MGAAAGVCFALDAVFLRGLTAALGPFGRVGFLINLAGFVVASVLGNLVIQRGFQMAPLRHVLPAMAAAEPVTAFLCARYVFGEHLNSGVVGALGVGGGLAAHGRRRRPVRARPDRPAPSRPAPQPAVPATAPSVPLDLAATPLPEGSSHLHVPGLDPMPALPCLPPFGSSGRRPDHLRRRTRRRSAADAGRAARRTRLNGPAARRQGGRPSPSSDARPPVASGPFRPAWSPRRSSAISSILPRSWSATDSSSEPLVPPAPASFVASLKSWCRFGYFSKCGALK